MTEKNTNCLAGMKCPACGSLEPFYIMAEVCVLVHDDGTDPVVANGETLWDNDSWCRCAMCSHVGDVSAFTIDSDPEGQNNEDS